MLEEKHDFLIVGSCAGSATLARELESALDLYRAALRKRLLRCVSSSGQ